MNIYCCSCKSRIPARLTNGKEIYSHRKDLTYLPFWICDECNNYVGCHPNQTNPLGTIPTPEIRKLRSQIHSLMDPLWKNKLIHRKDLYKQISNELGYEFHTAKIKTVEEAIQIIEIVVIIKDKLNEYSRMVR